MLSLYRACACRLHNLQYCFQLVAKQLVRKGRGASTRPARISDWSESMPPTAFGSVLAIGAIHRAVRAKARRTTKTSPWGPSWPSGPSTPLTGPSAERRAERPKSSCFLHDPDPRGEMHPQPYSVI